MCWRVLSALKVKVESEGKVWSLSGHDRETWSKTESTGPPATGADATPSLHSHKQWGRGGQQQQQPAPTAWEVKHSSLDFFRVGHWSWHSPLPRVNDLASKPCALAYLYPMCYVFCEHKVVKETDDIKMKDTTSILIVCVNTAPASPFLC